ncbi:MAG TPA: BTAD domain-containing putative transcriptional regulator, partial [Egibacteraceae bacterium]
AVLGLSAVVDGPRRAATVAAQCDDRGDRWGAALARLLGGLGGARGSTPDPAPLDAAAAAFDELDARALAAWAAAGAALARAATGSDDAADAAVAARSRARGAAVDGPELLALQALALADPVRAAAHAERLAALRAVCGLQLGGGGGGGVVRAPAATSELRLFGGLALTLEGRPVELDGLRPRARRVLRLLALHAGRALHRETIAREMWPDADSDTAMRNLHVVLSQLRTVLEPGAGRGSRSLLVRDGDSYRLQLPPGAVVDLVEFDAAVAAGRAAERAGDTDAAVAAFERALDLHTDELLPEEGPAEWVVPERERCRAEASDAAQRLAEHLAARGDGRAAIAACVRGLRIDRYRDLLWRTLVTLHERAGDAAAAAQTRRRYAALLAELGIET